MSTEKQVAANRKNSQNSTGPVTPEGKARSSMNALKHGLRSERTVILGESHEEFEEFSQKMLSDLNPQGALETFFAEKVVEDMWRAQRAAFIEASYFSWGQTRTNLTNEGWEKADDAGKEWLQNLFWVRTWYECRNDIKVLHRYETGIMRRITQCLRELRLIQKSRPAPAPAHSTPAETVLKAALSEPSPARHDAPHSPDSPAQHTPTQYAAGHQLAAPDEAQTPAVVNAVSKAGPGPAKPQQDQTGAGPSALLPNEPISPLKT